MNGSSFGIDATVACAPASIANPSAILPARRIAPPASIEPVINSQLRMTAERDSGKVIDER
jgi:hypothetical protein